MPLATQKEVIEEVQEYLGKVQTASTREILVALSHSLRKKDRYFHHPDFPERLTRLARKGILAKVIVKGRAVYFLPVQDKIFNYSDEAERLIAADYYEEQGFVGVASILRIAKKGGSTKS